MMKLDLSLKRMDSLMVSSNIKKMSRLELLYTYVANPAKEVAQQIKELPEGLRHYIQENPADPDATYREKAGKQNRGYVANVIEAAGAAAALSQTTSMRKIPAVTASS